MENILSKIRFFSANAVPVILQSEVAECAPVCVAMVLGFHGHYKSINEMRELQQVSQKGARLSQLMAIAEKVGLGSRPLRAELHQLSAVKLPCILHWNLNHYVVLVKVTKNRLIINDPAVGRISMAFSEASKSFTGVVLELTPKFDFTIREPVKKYPIAQIFGKIIGLKRSLFHIFIAGILLQLLTLATPLFLQQVVDKVVVNGDADLLVTLGIGFILLTLATVFLMALRRWQTIYLSTIFNVQWAANVFAKMLRLPLDYFEKRHVGDVVSRFGSTAAIQAAITYTAVETIIDGLMAVLILVVMLVYSAKLTLITIFALIIYILIRISTYTRIKSVSNMQVQSFSAQQGFLIESIRGVRSIQLFSNQLHRTGRWSNLVVETANRDISKQKLDLLLTSASSLIQGIEKIIVIWAGASLVLADSAFSVGMLLAFLAYKDQFFQRVCGLVDKTAEIKLVSVHAERLADIVLTQDADFNFKKHWIEEGSQIVLKIENVSFRYAETEPFVFQNVCLDVKRGEFIALIGPSGCGKTTLLKIILGFAPCTSGRIAYSGNDRAEGDNMEYHKIIGTVLQDDCLFSGTIMENITFFDNNADEGFARECAARAAILSEIVSMPMQFNTLVGDMGAALSGGQKQRILLARALFKKPEILILDEATSHLDSENENLVSRAISDLQITRIVVAHRRETIAMASRVLELSEGGLKNIDKSDLVSR